MMKTHCSRISTMMWIAAILPGTALLALAARAAETTGANAPAKPTVVWDAGSGRAVLTNGPLELTVETKPGLNARLLRNVKTGQIYADGDYGWEGGAFPKVEGVPVTTNHPDGSRSLAVKGRLGPINVEQVFTAPAREPGVIVEEITISNPSDQTADTAAFKCGFTKQVRQGDAWSPDANDIRFCPIPYRRETNGQMQDFPLREVAEHGVTFAGWMEPPRPTPIWGAEGWVWSKANSAFLLAKYNPDSMEWSLMEPVKRGAETAIRFAGAGQWKHGHPEGSARLEPGKSYRFGPTRLQAVDGDWKQAYYAYRGWIESKGCKPPADYNPPVHWNELYDNEYFGRVCGSCGEYMGDSKPGYSPELYQVIQKLLDQYYTLDLMKAEAAKAKELGCEVLYMDPGWDTGERGGLQVWDAKRLGPMKTYVEMIKKDYGFRGIGLWCSLAGVPPTYCDAQAYPTAQVLTKDGQKAKLLICHPCPGFLDEKEKLLLELCRNGAVFLMFDSNQYSGPCYDKTHGHAIPSTREEHAKATCELARRVKAKYPNVLIEMHDPITGPCNIHYTPTYFGYHPPTSFDCLWGHEFMWDSMGDLLSGRAVSLYYYNLAYSIPLYLHISLKQENENALLFWWYASTCRHLGVGGKPAPAAWEADKRAMKTYLALKRFYTQGAFYGIEETVHAHTLPDLKESVLNAFNLDDKPVEKRIEFRMADVGLPAGAVKIEDAEFRQEGDKITLNLAIPARGQRLVKIKQ